MSVTYCAKTTYVIRWAPNVAAAAALAMRDTTAGVAPPPGLSVVQGAPTEPMMGIVCRTGSSTAVAAIIVSSAIVAAAVAAPKGEAFDRWARLRLPITRIRLPRDKI